LKSGERRKIILTLSAGEWPDVYWVGLRSARRFHPLL